MSLGKITSIAFMLLISMVLLSGAVFSADIPVTIDDVKVNGDSLSSGDSNKIGVESGEELEIKVILTASAGTENVQVEAEISGYEYDYVESVSDKTKTFNMDANTTHKKNLYINLPQNVEEDSYKLRIIVSNRDDKEVIQNYNLKIDAPRHSMAIMDILLTPASEVAAGKSLLAAVRAKNLGDRDEDSVKVTVSIPELGLSASDYIDEVEYGDAETSEELFLRIPSCTEAGAYDVVAKVAYEGGHEDVTEKASIEVVEGDSCVVDTDEDDEADDEVDDLELEEFDELLDFLVDDADIMDDDEADDDREGMLRTALEIALIGLIIVLVIVGIVAGFAGLSRRNEF
jgi:hypothetical protein